MQFLRANLRYATRLSRTTFQAPRPFFNRAFSQNARAAPRAWKPAAMAAGFGVAFFAGGVVYNESVVKPVYEAEDAPPGYSWYNAKAINMQFLCPDGWHQTAMEHDLTSAYVFSEEDPGINGIFTTGVSIRHIMLNSEKELHASFETLLAGLQQTADVEALWNVELNAKLSNRGYLVRGKDDSKFIVGVILNRMDNSLLFSMFEAPADKFVEKWQIASDVMIRMRFPTSE